MSKGLGITGQFDIEQIPGKRYIRYPAAAEHEATVPRQSQAPSSRSFGAFFKPLLPVTSHEKPTSTKACLAFHKPWMDPYPPRINDCTESPRAAQLQASLPRCAGYRQTISQVVARGYGMNLISTQLIITCSPGNYCVTVQLSAARRARNSELRQQLKRKRNELAALVRPSLRLCRRVWKQTRLFSVTLLSGTFFPQIRSRGLRPRILRMQVLGLGTTLLCSGWRHNGMYRYLAHTFDPAPLGGFGPCTLVTSPGQFPVHCVGSGLFALRRVIHTNQTKGRTLLQKRQLIRFRVKKGGPLQDLSIGPLRDQFGDGTGKHLDAKVDNSRTRT
ncbi:hypothetical protein B0I37DRAFT_32037 [Chaetomium sp. MPI-CAGE-AT-0009]|nr:hypothetical protein B0I37DRAFT_32037 [Chaetomium sp. MPI-CAGE-AT-0009]